MGLLACFQNPKPIIGMVHLGPLPGAISYQGAALQTIIDAAVADVDALQQGGVDGLLFENSGDAPYRREGAEAYSIAGFSLVLHEIVKQVKVPFGVHFLRNAPFAGLSITHLTGGRFIRYNFLIDAYVTDQGIIQGNAAEVMQYRKLLGSKVLVLGDVHGKYATPLADRPIDEAASDLVYRGLADAVIVSGSQSGKPPRKDYLKQVKSVIHETPVIIGSGLNPSNLDPFLLLADAAIVGSYFKQDGRFHNPVDKTRVTEFMQQVKQLRA